MNKDSEMGHGGDAKPMGDANLLLFLNLTGELFYIVAHRMKSQDISPELQQKVFNDLSLAISAPDTIQDLLTGRVQIIRQSYAEVRARMNSIVHNTIMKINDYSMERLFELTLIATKYQFVVCVHPSDILLIVLNHLDAMRAMVSDRLAQEQMAGLHDILVESYGQEPYDVMSDFRNAVLNYVMDVRLKMTNLINLGLQLPTGEFVMDYTVAHSDCTSQPVRIECYEYDRDGEFTGTTTIVFEEPEVICRPRRKSSLSHYGDRVITLGQSIYDYDLPGRPVLTQNKEASPTKTAMNESDATNRHEPQPIQSIRNSSLKEPKWKPAEGNRVDALSAVQGLDLCSTLLGCESVTSDALILSMDNVGIENPLESISGKNFSRIVTDDVSVSTVRIDARFDRRESKVNLANILRRLEMPDTEPEPSDPPSRVQMSDLIENMLDTNDSI